MTTGTPKVMEVVKESSGHVIPVRKFSQEILNAPVKWKVVNAGFVGSSGFCALIDRNNDPWSCTGFHSDDKRVQEEHEGTCMETWDTVWHLPGETLEEATVACREGRFTGGVACHINDCELLDDRPEANDTNEAL